MQLTDENEPISPFYYGEFPAYFAILPKPTNREHVHWQAIKPIMCSIRNSVCANGYLLTDMIT